MKSNAEVDPTFDAERVKMSIGGLIQVIVVLQSRLEKAVEAPAFDSGSDLTDTSSIRTASSTRG